ncbi:MAG: NAD(P)/FAD-dependent oxidoreductase [Thermoplasmata archaeon]|nr:NAD(P)/FAD-dependent oxidoreductase [Thermoplasmata archaeon]
MASGLRDVIIVGAGPVGSYASYLAASQSLSTVLIDRRSAIGSPLKCAGLVNPGVFDLKGINKLGPDVILNDIIGADVFSPSGSILQLRGRKTKAFSIERALFDRKMFFLALENKVEAYLGHKVVEIVRSDDYWKVRTIGVSGDRTFSAKTLIGCDGTSSITRRALGIEKPGTVLNGISVEGTISGDVDVPRNIVGVFVGENTAKGLFAWYIPNGENDRVKLGLSTTEGGNIREKFDIFLNDPRLLTFIGSKGDKMAFKPTSMTISPIPIGVPSRICSENGIILGDSAAMAKATSGGGIYPGLLACKDLFDEVERSGDISNKTIERFQSNWRKGNGKELMRSNLIRSIIDDISDSEIDMLVDRLGNKKILSLINEKGDIDRPVELGAAILKENPGLLMLIPRFMPKLIKLIR